MLSAEQISTRPNALRRRLVAVGVSALILAGCSSEMPDTPAPTPSWTHYPDGGKYNIDCTQLAKGAMLSCVAKVPGTYALHNEPYDNPDSMPIATAHPQTTNEPFNLIPVNPVTAECGEGYVTFQPAPDSGDHGTYEVYSFDLC